MANFCTAVLRRLQCNLPSGKFVLLRVGDPGVEQAKVIAKQMQAIFPQSVRAAKNAGIERMKLAKIELAARLSSERKRLDVVERAKALAAKQTKFAETEEVKVTKREFGMLCGLARDLPDGWQVEIFKHAVFHWSDFMDDVKIEVETALEVLGRGDDPFHPELLSDHLLTTARRFRGQRERLSQRTYLRPFIPLLRAFWPVAVELFIDHRQLRGGDHPARVWQSWSDPEFCRLSSYLLVLGNSNHIR